MKIPVAFGAVSVIALGLFFATRTTNRRNNVCKTFDDYYTDTDSNQNCYHNPDGDLPVPEIVKRWGYPIEEHKVITDDGYILTVFRIPHSQQASSKPNGPPIFLQHGYKANSKCFTTTGNKSLGFILANAGYDVWLGNFRGTQYSREHKSLNNTDERFWEFTLHHHGIYDVGAQINYIYERTGQKVIYLGFSMGATSALLYSSTFPQVAKSKVKILVLMAPFVSAEGISSFTSFGLKLFPYVQPLLQIVSKGQYYPNNIYFFNRYLWQQLCYPYPFQMKVCQFFDMWSAGFNYEQNDPETLPVILLQFLETSSLKLVLHLSQISENNHLQQFDYGIQENLKLYGSPNPPIYNLSRLQVPVHIIVSENDMTSTKVAVEKVFSSLPEAVKPYKLHVIENSKFNHFDFLFARDVVPLVYKHVLSFLKAL